MTIDELRDEIDEIDREIVQLLSYRVELAKRIGYKKEDQGDEVRNLSREGDVLQNVKEAAEQVGLDADLALEVFLTIIGESIVRQRASEEEKSLWERHIEPAEEPQPDSGCTADDFREGQRVYNLCTNRIVRIKEIGDIGILVDDPGYDQPLLFDAQHLHPSISYGDSPEFMGESHDFKMEGEEEEYEPDLGYHWLRSKEYGPTGRIDHVVQVVRRNGVKSIHQDNGEIVPFPLDAEWGGPIE